MRHSFTAAARAELQEAVEFYDGRRPGLGRELSDEVKETILRILQNPTLSKRLSENTFQRRLNRFPYYLIYQKKPDRVRIVAVAHFRRHPNYWRDRLGS